MLLSYFEVLDLGGSFADAGDAASLLILTDLLLLSAGLLIPDELYDVPDKGVPPSFPLPALALPLRHEELLAPAFPLPFHLHLR